MAQREIVKKVTNAVQYSDGTIRLDNVRLSYPHLDKPYAGKNDKGESTVAKYGVVAMLPKATHTAAKDLVKAAIQELLKQNDAKVGINKWCLQNGDDSGKDDYEGYFTVSTRESRRPSVRDRKGTQMSEKEVEDTFYGGCYGNVLIRLWYQDGVKVGKGYGQRVNAGLVAVQFVKDGEPFGEGRIDDEGVFESQDDGGGDGFDDEDSGGL